MSSDDHTPPECDVRCCCGSLLARIVPGGIELKCRRCRRHTVVPLADGVPGPPVTRGEGAKT